MWEEAADPSSQRGRKVAGQDQPLSTATAGYRDLLKAEPLSPQTRREREMTWYAEARDRQATTSASILQQYYVSIL